MIDTTVDKHNAYCTVNSAVMLEWEMRVNNELTFKDVFYIKLHL